MVHTKLRQGTQTILKKYKHLKTLPKIFYHHHHLRYWPLGQLSGMAAHMKGQCSRENPYQIWGRYLECFWNISINIKQALFMTILSFDLQAWPWPSTYLKKMFQMALLLLKESNCATLILNPCINEDVMSQTSSIYDHFIIWLSSVTLTFILPEQMFQMAPLLLKKNNCA